MRLLGVFAARNGEQYQRSDEVIVRTFRGLEAGVVLTQAQDETVIDGQHDEGTVIRRMSTEDQDHRQRQHAGKNRRLDTCQRYIRAAGLQMKLIDLEELFGGERIIVYYLAEERVDFRELVKVLASEFKTRIEMRQIGVRDEAKMLADYGDCGKPVCCNTHLSTMPPVSMKMAKLQKATLDPTKISGRCGRLKCCLRYEFEMYEDWHQQMPAIGAEVLTREGKVTVLGQELLAQQLLVQTEDHRRITILLDEIIPT